MDEPRRPTLEVLVVEDDDATRAMLERCVTRAGYLPVTTASGAEALEVLRDRDIRMVLTDWLMPGMDGLTLCRRLRASQQVDLVYVIMLTIQGERSHLVKAFEAGVDDFLVKPVDETELVARLRAAWRIVRLQADLITRQLDLQRVNGELAMANDRLLQLAVTDELTGIPNRRCAMQRLQEHWARSLRYEQPIACVLIDVDHLRQVNDKHGHDAGDHVLCEVARSLTRSVRAIDVLCRFSGQEFLLILPEHTLDEAIVVAERCRRNVEADLRIQAPEFAPITVSVGLAERTRGMLRQEELLRAAEVAKDQAKQAGHNRVIPSEAA